MTVPHVLPLVVVLAVLAILGALVRRRAPGGHVRGIQWTGLSLVAAAGAAYASFAVACVLVGEVGPVALAFTTWASSLALGAAALAGRRFAGGGPIGPPRRSWSSAVGLGTWYLVTGVLRLSVLLLGAAQAFPALRLAIDPIQSLAESMAPMRGTALALLAPPLLVFGPVGEELAFRGLLQPALGSWLRPAAAVAVTSLLFAAMHWYYGPRVVFVLFMGGVLGWARVASGGLRAPIVLHVLVNAVGLASIVATTWWGG